VGGYTGPGVKTIVPPRAELKCSVRLVPNMKGEKVVRLVKAYVKKRNPDVRVEGGSSAPPYKGKTTGPFVEAAKRAVKFAFGKDPVFVREGGTIGAVLSMEQILRCPIVFMGLSLPDHGYHAPNENFDWGQAGGGMVAFAKLFEEVVAR
jgi:acetylornithine deacetylase/succinyl-diaminopimelate desuccinylase-like protein